MSKQLVFIDDSGDPGFKSESSDNFVMAAALFIDPEVAESLMHEIDDYRKSLGWKYNHEFKFTKNPKDVVSEMLRRARNYDFKIYAVYIEKSDFREITPAMAPFFDREKLYNWTIKELLREIPLETAKITIDGRSSKQHKKDTATYLRREVNGDNSKKLEFKFDDSVTTDLLQLADLIAGSINRSLQPDKTDSKDYISIFSDKIVKIQKITFR
ncbi:DUF3800 domain-containing protein [Candidatus Saccharibacteria bacterium]|nr:DUF3800 domain-containing protein [Candidatus Saccharibacteria bacterium]